MAGREVDTPEGKRIEWSQPEILLYDDDPYIRMSYPDLVEDGGKFYVTETQKNVGRVHEIRNRYSTACSLSGTTGPSPSRVWRSVFRPANRCPPKRRCPSCRN